MSLQSNGGEASNAKTDVPHSSMNNSERLEPCSSQENYYRSLLFTNIFSSKSPFAERTCGSRRPSADNSNNKSQRLYQSQRDDEASLGVKPAATASTSQGLFSSNPGLWGYSLFAGISSRLEAALQTPAPEETRRCKTPHVVRKPIKDRSVFGQPEINLHIDKHLHHRVVRKELSHESLDTLDSGHSMGSSRASMSELTGFDVHDPLSAYRESASSVGIGSSLESSEAEESAVDESVETFCSRSESRESVQSDESSSSWTSSEDSQAQASNKLAKTFMQMFVNKIFNTGYVSLNYRKSVVY